MRTANSAGRVVVLGADGRVLDVEAASGGLFSADPQAVYGRWEEFRAWADTAGFEQARPGSAESPHAVVPGPAQVFAIGLNYRDHAAESGFALPAEPVVFTKYVPSFTGPDSEITLSGGNVDWEVELVAVIGAGGHDIAERDGWDHVAGLTVGQDISDRSTQFAAAPPQFGMGKSYPGYSPVGPCLVTPDELPDRDDIALGCEVNGRSVQKAPPPTWSSGVSRGVCKPRVDQDRLA